MRLQASIIGLFSMISNVPFRFGHGCISITALVVIHEQKFTMGSSFCMFRRQHSVGPELPS